MTDNSLLTILCEWVNIAFSEVLPDNIISDDLWDGYHIARILNDISPDVVFTQSWLQCINKDISDSFLTRLTNLDSAVNVIAEYHAKVCSKTYASHLTPKTALIADKSSRHELCLLMQSILCCAVQANKQSFYVACITNMDLSKQHVIMDSIKMMMNPANQFEIKPDISSLTLSSATAGSSPDLNDPAVLEMKLRTLTSELNIAIEHRNESEHACEKLDTQLLSIQEETSSLFRENAALKQRLSSSQVVDEDVLQSQKEHYEHEINNLKIQLEAMETVKDDLDVKCEVLNTEVIKLQSRIHEFTDTECVNRELKDEIDVLREHKQEVKLLDRTVAALKNKLESFDSTKVLCKQLEVKHRDMIKKNIDLEEENKRIEILKSQLENYKRRQVELQVQLSEANMRGDKLKISLKREKEISADKESQRVELELLQGEDLQYKAESLCSEMGQVMNESGDSLNASQLPLNVQEKYMRMKKEHTQLKENQELQVVIADELMKMKLDDAITRIETLENDNKELNMSYIELDQKYTEAKDLLATQPINIKYSDVDSAKEVSLFNNQDMYIQFEKCKAELTEKTKFLDQYKKNVDLLNSEVKTSRKKECECEKKFQHYMCKAKQAISFYKNSFRNQNNSELNESTRVAFLESSLEQKEIEFSILERDLTLMRKSDYQITSLFHNKNLKINDNIVSNIIDIKKK